MDTSRRSSSTCNPVRHIRRLAAAELRAAEPAADRTTGSSLRARIGKLQPGSMQQGMQSGYPSSQLGSQSGPFQTGQTGQRPSAPVSSATQGQIRSSLEASGFKNVTVLPQSYLIRATAPDGSQVVMQVSSDGVYGVVVNSTDQASSSGTGGDQHRRHQQQHRERQRQHRRHKRHRGHKQRHRERQHRRSQRHWRRPAAAPEVSAPQTQAALGAQAAAPAVSAPAAAAKPAAPGLAAAAAASSTGTAGTSGKSSGKGQTTTR